MLWLAAVAAFGHIALEEPQARYPSDGSNNNKACPCGVGQSNRLCDVATDRSDPDRNEDRVTVFEAGQTITLRFRETIGHAGRYRVAFDRSGADLEDFNRNILLDVPDPGGATGNIGQGDVWELDVTLPLTPCENCTLQLVQMMDGNTNDPVPDPAGRSSYYQCVDIVLTAGTAPTTPPTDTGMPALDDEGKDGCGCVTPATQSPAALFLLAPFVARRRKHLA